MVNDELMKKVGSLMQDSSLVFLRGQLRNIVMSEKDDSKDVYYLADLRVPRKLDVDNVYETSFSVVHVCFGSDFVRKNSLTPDKIKQFKDNEVLLNLTLNGSVQTYKSKSDGQTYKSNNIKFYVEDIILLNSIDKPDFSSSRKVIAI